MFVDYSRSYTEWWRRKQLRKSGGHSVRQEVLLTYEVAMQDSDIEPTGLVVISIEALRHLLTESGWERAEEPALGRQWRDDVCPWHPDSIETRDRQRGGA